MGIKIDKKMILTGVSFLFWLGSVAMGRISDGVKDTMDKKEQEEFIEKITNEVGEKLAKELKKGS